jgi:signal transduction histidine kinase
MMHGNTQEAADSERLAGISQTSFQMLVENTADGVLVVDLAGMVLYANRAAAAIFGHSVDDLCHVPLGRPVAPGDIAEIAVHRPDRTLAEAEMRVVEILWDGKPALLASLRDVSARRSEEERRYQSQRLEAIGRVAAGIVHDFRNVISVFKAGLRLLQKQLAGNEIGDSKIITLIEEMLQRAKNAEALTQQLLAFSRQQALAPESVNLNDRIRSLSSFLERTLGSGIELKTDLAPDIGPTCIDANQFDIALLNLAINARDAMADKGILSISTRVTVEPCRSEPVRPAPFVCVTISDTGCGISREVLAHVFEPFFTTKPNGHGTGLGLSQVHGFVSQSGGHVRIDSEPGKGTRVHLLFPATTEEL